MQEKLRTKIIWALVAATAAISALNVILYFANGAFGAAWFIVSLGVYGIVFVAALALGMTDPGSLQRIPAKDSQPTPPAPQPQAPEPQAPEPRVISPRTIYETPTGRLEAAGDRRAYLAITHDGIRSLDDVEDTIDSWQHRPAAASEQAVAVAVDRHDRRHPRRHNEHPPQEVRP